MTFRSPGEKCFVVFPSQIMFFYSQLLKSGALEKEKEFIAPYTPQTESEAQIESPTSRQI